MNDTSRDTERDDEHRARATRQARLSPIWIVPIVALLIGAWLVYDNYASRGPVITLTMDSADGIEPARPSSRRAMSKSARSNPSLSRRISRTSSSRPA